MEPVKVEIFGKSNAVLKSADSMDESNYRSPSYAGLENRHSHQADFEDASLSSGGSEGVSPVGSPRAASSRLATSESPRSNGKKESNGLRSKRGGKALKIMVTSPKEQEHRRKVLYLDSVAGNAPLYPLDLRELSADSGPEDAESDRSSVFSPEVAANGFGSPIELPSRDRFEDQLNRRAEVEKRMQVTSVGDDMSFRDFREGVPMDVSIRGFDTFSDSQVGKEYEEKFSVEEESDVDARRSLPYFILKTLALILVWYIFSTLLTLYNKELLGVHLGHFPAPLLMNTIHFSMQAVISTVMVRYVNPSLLPTVHMSWRDYCIRVVPTAVATALDIDLTNVSLIFITVTFETMCKSGAPVFLLLFAFIFKIEVPSYKLFGIMITISAGVMLTVAKETEFDIVGFILVMAAAIMSGFRWTVTQLLLQREEYGLNNPFAVMSYLTPVMAAVSMVLSLLADPWSKFSDTHYFDSPGHVMTSCALMVLGGGLAFCMVSAEYVLISQTSALTLTVAGIVKEVVTILVAVTFFKDSFTLSKMVGLVVIILGVSMFNWMRYQSLVRAGSEEHLTGSRQGHHSYVALKESNAVFELGDELDDVL